MNFLELPADLTLEFFAEGAANVVYSISALPHSPSAPSEANSESDEYGPGTPPPSEISMLSIHALTAGKLLRLRKDLPTATSILDAQLDFERHIKPYFHEIDLVQQKVVCLPVSLVERCNEELYRMEAEGARPEKRGGVYLRTDGYGTLVTDMARRESIAFSINLKPKWLVQSPSAPEEAKRCRTCALRAMRASQKAKRNREGHVSEEGGFCPLHLLSGDEDKVYDAIDAVVPGPAKILLMESADLRHRIFKVLQSSFILQRLKQMQLKLDPQGILAADPTDPDFLTAMALRDCTIFVAGLSDGSIEVRLGDLDMKSPSKAGYWRSLEEDLIREGWYTATEVYDCDKAVECALQV
ncbi:Inositol-pentakisphosphate 2-kinase [Varicellaria rhodocarpa]|nr:Inositol-pentakisphosphate 2-kinase [Varicellaria rhodocarpa]